MPRRSKSPAREAADMIADGKIVAWFQGRMEFGPRALGNRSLLADPRRPRYAQHPQSNGQAPRRLPAVRAERAGRTRRRMVRGRRRILGQPRIHAVRMGQAGRRERIPAVIHQDGTARVQLVRREANPRFHELISHFFARTGVPLVLNTSFNDSEPIVCTPTHAIATFRKSGIDALFMDDICLTAR